MKKFLGFCVVGFFLLSCRSKFHMAQEGVMDYAYIDTSVTQVIQEDGQPRLLIGITVDQMRYDYLQRFEQDFELDAGGFPD